MGRGRKVCAWVVWRWIDKSSEGPKGWAGGLKFLADLFQSRKLCRNIYHEYSICNPKSDVENSQANFRIKPVRKYISSADPRSYLAPCRTPTWNPPIPDPKTFPEQNQKPSQLSQSERSGNMAVKHVCIFESTFDL